MRVPSVAEQSRGVPSIHKRGHAYISRIKLKIKEVGIANTLFNTLIVKKLVLLFVVVHIASYIYQMLTTTSVLKSTIQMTNRWQMTIEGGKIRLKLKK